MTNALVVEKQVEETALARFTVKLAALIDITRTIDRNRDDVVHASQPNGEILYVFDTNVVQMFLEPYKNPQFSEAFFSKVWGSSPDRSRLINSQASLIASEYLMSGALPGQKGRGRWYMTRGHVGELDRQFVHIIAWAKTLADRLREDEEFANFTVLRAKQITKLSELDPFKDRAAILKLAGAQGLPDDHDQGLASLDRDSYIQRANGVRARELCRFLATDWISEPPQQLVRLRHGRIATKFRELEDYLGAQVDWDAVQKESNEWRDVITDILLRQDSKTKSDRALTSDCDALALISWANRHWAKPHQRVVFVTGDRILLEACRQRYVESSQFYFARPVTHFAPILNPLSANSLVEHSQAFERLREVLEAAMVALNLGLLAGRDGEHRLRARDGFALFAQQSPAGVSKILRDYFPKVARPDWLMRQESALDSAVKELQFMELLLLEAYPHLVAERIEGLAKQRLEDAAASSGEALSNAIGKILGVALRESFRFSVQMMADAVLELLGALDEPTELSQRVSIQVQLSFSDRDDDFLDLEETVSWLRSLSREELEYRLEALEQHPPRMFALAALLAFVLETWKEAARYADLAARASETDSDRASPRTADESHEYLFLQAVALRFRLAAFSPEVEQDSSSIWREWRDAARFALHRCYRYHARTAEWSRALRARSEHAALHLAYAELLVFSSAALRPPLEKAVGDALRSLAKGIQHLSACETLCERARVHMENLKAEARQRASRAVHEAATRQFRYNMLAARVIGYQIQRLSPDHTRAVDELLSRLPAHVEVVWDKRPRIALAYHLAVQGRWDELRELPTADLTLTLDRTVIECMQSWTHPELPVGS